MTQQIVINYEVKLTSGEIKQHSGKAEEIDSFLRFTLEDGSIVEYKLIEVESYKSVGFRPFIMR